MTATGARRVVPTFDLQVHETSGGEEEQSDSVTTRFSSADRQEIVVEWREGGRQLKRPIGRRRMAEVLPDDDRRMLAPNRAAKAISAIKTRRGIRFMAQKDRVHCAIAGGCRDAAQPRLRRQIFDVMTRKMMQGRSCSELADRCG